MNKSLSFFLIGCVVGILVATGGFALFLKGQKNQAVDQQKIVLKLGHSLDPSHPVHQGMEEMKKKLEALSGGMMTIDIYPSGVLGSEVQCIEQLQNGLPHCAAVLEMSRLGAPRPICASAASSSR